MCRSLSKRNHLMPEDYFPPPVPTLFCPYLLTSCFINSIWLVIYCPWTKIQHLQPFPCQRFWYSDKILLSFYLLLRHYYSQGKQQRYPSHLRLVSTLSRNENKKKGRVAIILRTQPCHILVHDRRDAGSRCWNNEQRSDCTESEWLRTPLDSWYAQDSTACYSLALAIRKVACCWILRISKSTVAEEI